VHDSAISDYSSSKGDWIGYDNGTPNWLCWEHQYRGVWFNVEDFFPGVPVMELEQTELWFYHQASYPWDTSETYIEFWNGTASGPEEFLEQLTVTASHYTPVSLEHSPDWIQVEPEFWIIQNSELSLGGWPSVLGDNSDPTVVHSMVSDDMSTWEPWMYGSGTGGEFFISTYPEYPWQHGYALSPLSWGSVKALF